MRKWLGFFFRFLFAIFIGGCIALFIIQRDERFQHTVEGHIKDFFKTSYAADISCKVTNINLLRPSLTVESVVVTPTDADDTNWRWTARTGTVSSSWFKMLLAQAMPITVEIEDGRADSAIIGKQPTIVEHLNRLFALPDVGIPVFLKKLHITKSFFRLANSQVELLCPMQAELERVDNATKLTCYPTNSTITHHGIPYAQNAEGTVLLEFTDGEPSPYINVSLTGKLPILAPEQTSCFCYGSWQQGRGTFSLHNADRSFVIDPLNIDSDSNIDVALSASIALMQKIATSKEGATSCSGRCSAHIVTNLLDPFHTLRADCALHDASIKGINLPTTQFVISADKNKKEEHHLAHGIIDIQIPDAAFSGSWRWDNQTGGNLSLTNNKMMPVPLSRYWQLLPGQLEMQASLDHQGTATIEATCTLKNERLGTTMKGSGNLNVRGTVLSGTVNLGHEKAEIAADLAQRKITHAAYHDEKGKCLAKIDLQDGKSWKGFFDYALILSFLPQKIRDELNGQGVFNIDLERTGNSQLIKGSISLAGAAIKLPQLYNFITAFNAGVQIDAAKRTIAINDLDLKFNRGAMHSKRLSCHLNDHYVPSFIYAPIIIEDLFVSWHHDVFGLLSGMMTFEFKSQEKDTVKAAQELSESRSVSIAKGLLFIDRTQINIGNIFNQQVITPLATTAPVPGNDDLQLDIALKTRDHCTIQTGVVDARAKADLTIGGQLQQPIISGNIDVLSGELKFPYKPLHITHGKLYFLPNQLQDPLIEITAKNKIKKYQVTFQVNGSAQSPHIHVESDPTLTEEQVLALLFAGVEDSSLNVLMPTLVTQSMQQVMFGQNNPAQPTNKVTSYLKSWLKPLAHVRIVPRFNDEGGRGGLRGAIEIEVSEDFEAMIEKNFSLPEDYKINVEYSISDDVSIRGIRDERGDFGGEMELRWKFSQGTPWTQCAVIYFVGESFLLLRKRK